MRRRWELVVSRLDFETHGCVRTMVMMAPSSTLVLRLLLMPVFDAVVAAAGAVRLLRLLLLVLPLVIVVLHVIILDMVTCRRFQPCSGPGWALEMCPTSHRALYLVSASSSLNGGA